MKSLRQAVDIQLRAGFIRGDIEDRPDPMQFPEGQKRHGNRPDSNAGIPFLKPNEGVFGDARADGENRYWHASFLACNPNVPT